MIRRLTAADASEAAILITESIQYADAQAVLARGKGALAFPPALSRTWTAATVMGFQQYFPTSWVYIENRRLMSVVIAAIETRRGVQVFRPIIGGTRISEIPPAEHEAYLYMPLREAVPDAIAKGVTRTLVQYSPEHGNLDASLKRFSTANASTIRDVGAVREYETEFRLEEIRAKSAVLVGRDRG